MTKKQREFADKVVASAHEALADRAAEIALNHDAEAGAAYMAGIADGIRMDHAWRAGAVKHESN